VGWWENISIPIGQWRKKVCVRFPVYNTLIHNLVVRPGMILNFNLRDWDDVRPRNFYTSKISEERFGFGKLVGEFVTRYFPYYSTGVNIII